MAMICLTTRHFVGLHVVAALTNPFWLALQWVRESAFTYSLHTHYYIVMIGRIPFLQARLIVT